MHLTARALYPANEVASEISHFGASRCFLRRVEVGVGIGYSIQAVIYGSLLGALGFAAIPLLFPFGPLIGATALAGAYFGERILHRRAQQEGHECREEKFRYYPKNRVSANPSATKEHRAPLIHGGKPEQTVA